MYYQFGMQMMVGAKVAVDDLEKYVEHYILKLLSHAQQQALMGMIEDVRNAVQRREKTMNDNSCGLGYTGVPFDPAERIFVFGSNLGGIHGAGAARFAREKRGAIDGQGVGLQGQSYAIPTKEGTQSAGGRFIGATLALDKIADYVNGFIIFAQAHPELEFQVTQIGGGYAKIAAEDIAPLFANAPANCLFDEAWEEYLPAGTRFWGTF